MCDESKLHHQAEYGSKQKGKGRPGSKRAKALHQRFNHDKDNVEAKHEKKAVGYEEVCECRCRRNHALDMKRRKQRAGSEDDEKESELKAEKEEVFHKVTFLMSFAQGIAWTCQCLTVER